MESDILGIVGGGWEYFQTASYYLYRPRSGMSDNPNMVHDNIYAVASLYVTMVAIEALLQEQSIVH